jgi:PKD repeat protein
LPAPPRAAFSWAEPNASGNPFFITFDAPKSSGTQLHYTWSFGDGAKSAFGPTASHTYPSLGPCTVTLTVLDVASQKAAIAGTVRIVIPAPHAAFSWCTRYANAACNTMNCTDALLDASHSTGFHLRYNWTFGDGTRGHGIRFEHEFPDPGGLIEGSPIVTLTVVDIAGQRSSISHKVI